MIYLRGHIEGQRSVTMIAGKNVSEYSIIEDGEDTKVQIILKDGRHHTFTTTQPVLQVMRHLELEIG